MNPLIRPAGLARGLLAAVILLTGCSAENPAPVAIAAPGSEALATTRQVMLGLTIPASDVLFQIGDNTPADDAGWERIVAMAAMLGESANLMLTGPRDLNEPEWTMFSRELLARSQEAMLAAQQQDTDAVLEAGNGIYEACENCHTRYLPARIAERAAR